MIDTSYGIIHLFTRCTLLVLVLLAALTFVGVLSSLTVLALLSIAVLGTYHALMFVLSLDHGRLLNSIEFSSILRVVNMCGTGGRTPDNSSSEKSPESGQRAEHRVNSLQNCDGLVMLEVDKYVRYVMRDFISSWYHGWISSNDQFTSEIQYALEDISVALVSRSRKLNPHLLLRRAVRIYHRHFVNYLAAVRLTALRNSYARTTAVRDVQECFSSWHLALSSSEAELRYLQNVVNVLLEVLVPADVLVCPVGRRLVVTVLAHKLILPIVDLLSDPDWINRKLISTLIGSVDPAASGRRAGERPEVSPNINSDSLDRCGASDGDTQDGGQLSTTGSERTSPVRTDAGLATTNCSGESERPPPDDTEQQDSPISNSGIWQRMADELPSAFRNERQQEVSDILQEAAVSTGGCGSSSLDRKRNLRIPLSGSLEKISDIFTNAINVDFITGNLANYFKLSQSSSAGSEEGDRTAMATSPASDRSRRSPPDETDGDGVNDDVATTTESTNQASHNVSSGLERMMAMSMGPVLSQQLACRGESDAAVSNFSGTHPSVLPWSGDNDDDDVNNFPRKIVIGQSDISPKNTYGLRSEKMTLAWKQLDHSSEPVFEVTDISGPGHLELPKKELSKDGAEMEEAVSPNPIGATFTRLVIPSTEVIDEPGSGGQYVAYCIQYDAWFREPDSLKTFDVGSYVDISEPRASLQTNYVRRRFREFLALQVRLEEELQLRPLIKGVRGPNKWSVFPFNKLDKEALAERRLSLERYLQLLISKDDIANSHHLREFLAYGCDASIAYVRKINDSNLPVPRFDKFLMKTMTGVFDKLKTALPSLPHDPSPVEPVGGQNKTDRFLGFLNFNTSAIATGTDAAQLRLSFDYGFDAECADYVEDILGQYLGSYDTGNDKIDTAYDAGDIDAWIEDPWSLPSPSAPEKRSLAESADVNDVETLAQRTDQSNNEKEVPESLDDLIPLASVFINFSAETIQSDDVKVDSEHFVFLMKIVFGKVLEKWICDLIDNSLSEETFAHWLGVIVDTLWPGGSLSESSSNVRTESDKRQTYEATLRALKDYFPRLLVFILGDQYATGMKLFLDSFQHPKLLRNVIYQLLDLLVDSLIIRSRSQSIIEKLGPIS